MFSQVIVALKEEKHSKASLVYVHPNFESDTLVADISIVVVIIAFPSRIYSYLVSVGVISRV